MGYFHEAKKELCKYNGLRPPEYLEARTAYNNHALPIRSGYEIKLRYL